LLLAPEGCPGTDGSAIRRSRTLLRRSPKGEKFLCRILGLHLADEQQGHPTKFDGQAGFICLEKKGIESYPSKDKAVLFFEVADLQASIAAIGRNRLLRVERSWAVLHGPEGHNVLLLERPRGVALFRPRTAPIPASKRPALAWSRHTEPERCSSFSCCV
jgi:hypothetical protein